MLKIFLKDNYSFQVVSKYKLKVYNEIFENEMLAAKGRSQD